MISGNNLNKILILFVSGLCLVFILGYFVSYRVENPSFTHRIQPQQQQEQQTEEAMGRISELMGYIQENPEDVEALTELAQRFMSIEAYERAASFWERVLRVRPDRPSPRLNLAMCYFYMEKYQEAAYQLRRVLRLDPENISARYNLAMLYAQYLNSPDQAREHFRKVVESEQASVEQRERAKQELSRLEAEQD